MPKEEIRPGEFKKMPTGIQGLDEITGGGLPGGRATLLLGQAGSGKTILALQMLVNGAREYGEPGIFVAFEEDSRRIMANVAGFGWDLPGLAGSGFEFVDAQPSLDWVQSGSFDLLGLLAGLEAKVEAMGAKRIVFDSVDVLISLLHNPAGERNRGLTIIKSRGTGHSNQVHELVLKKSGITLADVYAAEGEVLMGTMRLQKEQSERAEKQRKALEVRRRQAAIEAEKAELQNRMESLQNEISRKDEELKLFLKMEEERRALEEQRSRDMEAMREGKTDSDALGNQTGE